LIFQGDKDSLYRKLLKSMTEEQLFHEKEFIEELTPFSTVKKLVEIISTGNSQMSILWK